MTKPTVLGMATGTVDTHAVVRVEPIGVILELGPGETVFAAARRHGYRWPTVCGGEGDCHACFCFVASGAEHASEPTAGEQLAIDSIVQVMAAPRGDVRLACQLRFAGPAVVIKRGVVRPVLEATT